MTINPSALPQRQRGMTWLGWLVVLLVVGIFGICTVKMVPAYSDYGTIKATINDALSDSRINLMSVTEVEDSLGKRFDINGVTGIKVSDLSISKADGELQIGLDYNVEEHLFYNVSVVMHFKHTFTKTLTSNQ